jgi:ATP-binding cassette, subfamily B, multidrug efflux pump
MASHQDEEVLGKAYDSRLMRRLLRYLRPYRWQTAIALGSIVLKAGADVLGPYLTHVVIDKYLAPVAGLRTVFDFFLSPAPLVGVAQVAGLAIGLLTFSFLLEYLQIYLMQWAGQMVMFDLRKEIFRHLQHMHIGFYDKNPVGRLVTRVTTDVDAVNEMFTSGVISIFEDVFVLVGIMVIMLNMNWRLASITFAVLPLISIATKVFRDKVRDSYRRIRVAIARINSYLQEHVSGMMVLQLFNREDRAARDFSKVNTLHMDAWRDAIMAHAVYYPIVEILSSIAIASVIWFGGIDVVRGARTLSINSQFLHKHVVLFRSLQTVPVIGFYLVRNVTTIGVLAAFIQYAQRFFRPIQDFSEKYNILQSAMASSERIFKLLDTPAEVSSPAMPRKSAGAGRVEFDHVWFAYRATSSGDGAAGASHLRSSPTEPDSAWDWILRDVSFTIEPGETVAIVGHTGAGKTTIISLLMRFYDVQRGAIKIDGVDVKEMDLAELRRRFGVVLQDPFLFTGTVEGNIRLGTGWITDEQIRAAAEDVNLSDFIRTLPNGFKEEVRERGSTLSTGQKQLISFARALAHKPKILILDEATSSVDTETEFRVRAALSRMVEGRTSVIIAHRLSTVQQADKILVMHKGQLREVGTHQQLLGERGIYYKLYQLQYKDQEIPSGKSPITANADD